MAIYTNLDAVEHGRHGMWESSRVRASQVGHIYDAIVRDDSDAVIAVDNGAPIAIGAYTGDGLQTRYATIAKDTDKIAVVGTPAIIKDAFTKAQAQDYNFYNKAGAVVKAYELVEEDIFAVADYQIDLNSQTLEVGATVIVDGNGKYKLVASASTEKFVGKVHSIAAGNALVGTDAFAMVRIEVIKNA